MCVDKQHRSVPVCLARAAGAPGEIQAVGNRAGWQHIGGLWVSRVSNTAVPCWKTARGFLGIQGTCLLQTKRLPQSTGFGIGAGGQALPHRTERDRGHLFSHCFQ